MIFARCFSMKFCRLGFGTENERKDFDLDQEKLLSSMGKTTLLFFIQRHRVLPFTVIL